MLNRLVEARLVLRALPRLLLVLACTHPALAVDGVQEINHAAVVASGGYPWSPGSGNYRLTSDLRPVGSLGISLEDDNVVIDFNGFALIGDGSAFDGVSGGPAPDGHTLRNGSIRGFGGKAVTSVAGCVIEDMQIKQNAGGGLEVGPNCLVRQNRIANNGGVGGLAGQGGGVVYADNLFFGNSGGDVSGAESGGGNHCDGRRCAPLPIREYYLTTTAYQGNEPTSPGVCAEGFHFASLWEIHDVSGLRYAKQLGRTASDAGEGPVSGDYGWIRTGAASGLFSVPSGRANCDGWTDNNFALGGSIVALADDWDDVSTNADFGYWDAQLRGCANVSPVWCVED